MLRLLDSDADGIVTRSELHSLHLTAEEYAVREKGALPQDLASLVDALYLGFDRTQMRAELELQRAAGGDLAVIEVALNVSPLGSCGQAGSQAVRQHGAYHACSS